TSRELRESGARAIFRTGPPSALRSPQCFIGTASPSCPGVTRWPMPARRRSTQVSLLPETVRRIDQLTAETQAAGQVPTLLAGVVRNGSLVHLSVAGGTDPARPQGAGESDADVQYRIGSITKTLTAVLVLQLRDQGKLGLDDPLERHLPDTVAGTTTLRQLLAHAGGLYREPAGPWWERSPGVDLEKLLATLAADTVDGLPTHRYHYSNVAYALLGALLERKTGQSRWDLTRPNLLLPPGMTRT